MGILLIPGLLLNINNDAILYKVPKSAVEGKKGQTIVSGVSYGDYIFCLEKTGREISKIKIGDLPARDKHRILLRFIKKFALEQTNYLKDEHHIKDRAIYFSVGRKWLIDEADKVYLQEIKGFRIEAHLINNNSIAILVYAKRTYRFITENGKLASVIDMKNLFKKLNDDLRDITVIYVGPDGEFFDSLDRLYFEPPEKIRRRANYDGPIAKLKRAGYKPMDRVYLIFDDKLRSVLREKFIQLNDIFVKKMLDEITSRNPSDYVEATEKLKDLLQNHKYYKAVFENEPKIIDEKLIRSIEGINVYSVSDYELVFGRKDDRHVSIEVKSVRDILDAIKNFGPYDNLREKLNKETIRIAILYDQEIYGKELERIKDGLKRALEKLLRGNVKVEFMKPKRISFTETVDCDLLIHIHRSETKDYWRLKNLYLREGIPPQAILLENYRSMKGKTAYFNNIAIGIFAKLGGRPWVIGKAISNLLGKSAYYVGFDVSRMEYEGQHASAACIVAYDGEGTYVKHKPIEVAVVKEHLNKENAEKLMTILIKDYLDTLKEKGLIEKKKEFSIVFMRDGVFSNDEIEGFKSTLERMNNELREKGQPFAIRLLLLEFKKMGGIPLFEREEKDGNINYDLAREGTYVMFRTLESPENKFALYIQTLGKGSGLRLVRSVKVSPRYYTYEDKEYGWLEDKADDLALAIYRLSRLNWSSFRGRSKLPVPVHYAHKMAYFMEKGVAPKTIEETKLYFL